MVLSMQIFREIVDWIKIKLVLICLFFDYFWDICRLFKQSRFSISKFLLLLERYTLGRLERIKEVQSASDRKLVKIYLAQESSKMDLCLVVSTYFRRHGVPIYLDIAIDATDYALKRSNEPEIEDPAFQEAFFVEMYKKCRNVYLKKVPFAI